MKSVGSISCAFLQHFDFVGFLAVKNMPGVGDAVPDFSLKDHTGAEVSLKSLKESGKKTLIWFYPKADTPG